MLNRLVLAVLVIKVHLDLLVQKEKLEEMEMTELLVSQERMERILSFCQSRRSPNHASSAHLDLQDPTAQWEPKDHLDQKDLLASHHAMVFPATSAWLVNPVQLADQDAKAHVEHPATQDVSSQFPDHKAHLVLPDHLDQKDQKDNPVQMVNLSKAHPENLASQANPEKKADLDPLALLAQQETMARKAVATIVQSHVPHQAIKQDPRTARSGFFGNLANGTTTVSSIIFFFVISFLQLVESRHKNHHFSL
jgi:hypothetical protein